MPLVDLKTDLTSLPFGSDRPGGGSSKQPFIVKDIPGKDKSFLDQIGDDREKSQFGFSIANDFGLRGGFLRPGAAIDDVERMLKMYTERNSPGTIFQAKQIALGLLANPLEVWLPGITEIQTGLNGIGIGHLPAFLSGYQPGPLKGKFTRENTYGMGNPAVGTNNLVAGKLGQTTDRSDYVKGVQNKKPFSAPTGLNQDTKDRVAMKTLYTSEQPSLDIVESDAIKFVISVVDNDKPNKRTWIHFRAFIDSFGDSFKSNWQSTNYVGRGENFYNYRGFDRTVNLGFTVAVQSKQEQKPLYEKLTYLASLTAPDYSDAGFMRGNLIYLTVGDYLVDVPGIFKGLSIGGMDKNPWEIGRNPDGTIDKTIAQLPHVVSVSNFQFTPIHNFVPQRGSKFIGYDNPMGGNQIEKIQPLEFLTAKEATSTYGNDFVGPQLVDPNLNTPPTTPPSVPFSPLIAQP